MKKIVSLLLFVCMIFALASCASNFQSNDDYTIEDEYNDFKLRLNRESVVAVDPRVENLHDGRIMLMADVKNNSATNKNISNIVISFAAWDKNGSPVIIKSENNPTNTYSLFEVTVDNVVVEDGKTWVADKGLTLAEASYNIKYVEAIVCSCTIGDTEYTNPLYSEWQSWFISRNIMDWVKEDKDSLETEETPVLTREERYPDFKKKLDAQEVLTMNEMMDDDLENDEIMLLTDLKNNSSGTVKSLTIAFVAWDSEGNPVMLKSQEGSSNDSYVKVVGFGDVTLEAGQTWLANNGVDVIGYKIKNDNISTVKAIVVSYVKSDDTTWKNPLYSEWAEFFGGNKLEAYMTAEGVGDTAQTTAQ